MRAYCEISAHADAHNLFFPHSEQPFCHELKPCYMFDFSVALDAVPQNICFFKKSDF